LRRAAQGREQQSGDAGQQYQDPEPAHELQWECRKREHRIECEAKHLSERELRRPRHARMPDVGDRCLLEPDPGRHAAQEAMSFSHAAQDVYHPSRQHVEVACIGLQIALHEVSKKAIEEPGAALLEPALSLAFPAASEDDVMTGKQRLEHLCRQRRRILEVGVHHEHRVPLRVVEACCDRRLVSEVPRESDHGQSRISAGPAQQQLAGAIVAAVIDKHEFHGAGEPSGDSIQLLS